ncbi:MAG: 16S rRNA (guanine(966)-N(2))-methyltransferase RsmD [Herpetosiphonaceae bacterium]|nr:16S rRNA (guanine(966)-N(2))-methyltransferase RsmD [Herpetosiphonaceae bacterium]
MRVITGTAKGHHLKGPPDMGTRPMLDRVKESLFAILEGYEVITGRALDLFAGTGSLGIELLSRGATWCDFVEQRRDVCQVIRENIKHTKLDHLARVHQLPVERYVEHPPVEPYAIIMLDPPYASPTIEPTIQSIADSRLVRDGTIVVVGHWPRLQLQIQYGQLDQLTSRRIGDSSFSIYECIQG